MPLATPAIKVDAVRRLGGEYATVVLHGENYDGAVRPHSLYGSVFRGCRGRDDSFKFKIKFKCIGWKEPLRPSHFAMPRQCNRASQRFSMYMC